MSPVDREIVRRKLERIVSNLRLLEPVRVLSLEAYKAEVYRRKAVEKLLQEVVDAAVDINAHLLTRCGRAAPDDFHESFLRVAEMGVLDAAFAARLAPSAGLRNRLVHQYDAIDDALVLRAVGTALDEYSRYVKAIEDFLRRS